MDSRPCLRRGKLKTVGMTAFRARVSFLTSVIRDPGEKVQIDSRPCLRRGKLKTAGMTAFRARVSFLTSVIRNPGEGLQMDSRLQTARMTC